MVNVIAKYKIPLGACDGELYRCKDYEHAVKQKYRLERESRFRSVEIEREEHEEKQD